MQRKWCGVALAEQRTQSDAYRKAILAALTGGTQDVTYSPEKGFMGGLRPSALGAGGQAAAKMLGSQAMTQLSTPQARPDLDPYERIKIGDQRAYEDPTVGDKPGFWDKLGYAFNPKKWDRLGKGDDYRTPGSVNPPAGGSLMK